MTPLRQRLIEDIRLRNFSQHTVEAYVRAVAHFARHYGCSPDQLDGEQVRAYLLQERKVSWSLYNQIRCALQFFYRVTRGRKCPRCGRCRRKSGPCRYDRPSPSDTISIATPVQFNRLYAKCDRPFPLSLAFGRTPHKVLFVMPLPHLVIPTATRVQVRLTGGPVVHPTAGYREWRGQFESTELIVALAVTVSGLARLLDTHVSSEHNFAGHERFVRAIR